MHSCHKIDSTEALENKKFRQSLQKAMAVNIFMFFVEIIAGFYSRSLSVMADSLDFFSDATGYGVGLYAIGRSSRLRSWLAIFNAIGMFLIGIWIAVEAFSRLATPIIPDASIMGSVGLLALVSNMLSAWWLYSHRKGDSLQQSFWLCSRNDMFNNIAIIIAALIVHTTQSRWPDMIVAILLLLLESASAIQVIRKARNELAAGEKSDCTHTH